MLPTNGAAQISAGDEGTGRLAAHWLGNDSSRAIRLKPGGPATRSDSMKLIVDLLKRVWQRGRPETDGYILRASEGDDRSSMADFVRILQMHDREGGRSNYPN
ncbi:hypothetical protein NLM33_44895 [Bradyrhizobium sp. CCGUVB1N3]|uniref:hypothetical protein n=1 Tax=Bradyrhizobium sp. CCGUVB1N3 TaxID=2949629 RepID=UPI0020B19630|nr:hypothetical protein [Bradyrhizobium sp. CCGUVB1N3]MCP3477300.1 hypothetical protein [Bradyrhizobium sp. CCGUVB1N3]